jgi:hypothetical protein
MANRIATRSSFALGSSIALGGLLLAGCPQIEKTDDDGPGEAGVPTEVQRAFNESCAITACHDSTNRQAGLDLSSTGSPNIIGGMSSQSTLPLVELGNVQGSYLALKLLPNPPSGTPMPPVDLPGTDDPTNVAIILGWIAGAQLPGGGGSEGGSTTDDPPAESSGSAEGESSSGGSDAMLCGLADVAPEAPNPFDIGMAAGQIPPDVGAALVNNCGCHEVDSADLIMGAFPYAGMVHFSTIAEIRADYMGVPVHELVLERVQSEQPNRMPPPYYCDLGDGSVITDADRQLLIDWLTAEAPDGATWMQ